jgi:hypothetical protein
MAGPPGSVVASPGEVSKLLEATPWLLAAFYYLFAPFFIEQARKRLIDYLDKVNEEWQGPKGSIPPHLTSKAIGATTDWVIDAPQLVPTLLLPLAGAVFSIHNNSIAGVILTFGTLVICTLTLWMYTRSPIEYQARRFIWHKYTLLSILGLVLNLAVAAILLLT